MYHSTTQTLITNYLTWDDTAVIIDTSAKTVVACRFHSGSFSIADTTVKPIYKHYLPKKTKCSPYFNLAGGW